MAYDKEKARWQRILRTYGITKEQYDDIDLGYCPVCLRPWDATVRPAVDHDHKSGEVRGLLCLFCNRYVVGRHRDGNVLRRAGDYLLATRRGWIVPPKPPKKRRRKKKKT